MVTQKLENIRKHICVENAIVKLAFTLKGEEQALARIGTELIKVGYLGSKELLALLCNSKPTKRQIKKLAKKVKYLGIIF